MTDTHSEARPGRRGWLLLASGVLLLVFGWLVQSDTEAEASSPTAASGKPAVLAVVEGVDITEAEIHELVGDQLTALETQRLAQEAQFRQQRYNLIKASLDRVVEDRLLAAEAKARGVLVDELVAAEVSSKVTPVTDADIDAFYASRTAQGQRMPPKERIIDQIRSFLGEDRTNQARSTFVDTLRGKYEAQVLLDDYRVELASTGFPSKGPAGAPVTIVEFSDFECPFCGKILPALQQVHEAYPEQVRIVFRQFPLNSIHPRAQKAAEASLCAADQGKFWEYHDALFAQQQSLGLEDLKAKAATLGLDGAAFASCLDGGTHADAVARDLRDGAAAGVSGTPALFVNGRFLNGVVPFEEIKRLVDLELAKKG